ncbi:MAG: cytochrome C oxidase subunit IV family protein [Pirellulaceae bacterium]
MIHHVVPIRTYTFVFIALLALLALTVAAAQIEHGVLNLVLGLSIAASKALLIVLFFMHIRYNTFVMCMAAVAGFLWLAILITLTMSDYVTRI